MVLELPQADPTFGKAAIRLNAAGASPKAPIVVPRIAGSGGTGLGVRVTLELGDDETVDSVTLVAGSTEVALTPVISGGQAVVDFVAAANVVDHADTPRRNRIVFETTLGVVDREFWCQSVPSWGAVFIENQEATTGRAKVFRGSDPAVVRSADCSMSFNLLPTLGDHQFTQHLFPGNRWANTLRGWGGAATCQVIASWDPSLIGEQDVGDVHGYYWASATDGDHSLTFRLRAAAGSAFYVDLPASINVGERPCS